MRAACFARYISPVAEWWDPKCDTKIMIRGGDDGGDDFEGSVAAANAAADTADVAPEKGCALLRAVKWRGVKFM